MSSTLEKQIAEMMEINKGLMLECDENKANSRALRRKSRDIEQSLATLSFEQLIESKGLERRGSKDYSDEELQTTFLEFDADKSGFIDRSELEKVHA